MNAARATRVILAPSARIEIARHLSSCYPHEGCGALLAGDADASTVHIDDAIALPNLASDTRDDRFVIAPLAYAALEQKLSSEGKHRRVVGFFHSHPDSPARPSSIDLEMALGLFEAVRCIYIYAIQNVSRTGADPLAGELTFWQLNAQLTDFEALPVDN